MMHLKASNTEVDFWASSCYIAEKTAGVHHEGKLLWATADRNPVECTARNSCFGLKHAFKVDWRAQYTVHVDENDSK